MLPGMAQTALNRACQRSERERSSFLDFGVCESPRQLGDSARFRPGGPTVVRALVSSPPQAGTSMNRIGICSMSAEGSMLIAAQSSDRGRSKRSTAA